MVNKSLPAAEVDHWLILTWPNGMVTKFVAKYLLSAPQNTKVGHIVSVCWDLRYNLKQKSEPSGGVDGPIEKVAWLDCKQD